MAALNRPMLIRLSEYLLILENLIKKRQQKISSAKLAKLFGNKSSQVRQDIFHINSISNNFRQGYDISDLIVAIREALGLNKKQNVIIIGAGKLGLAIGLHVPFYNYGMHLAGLFDIIINNKNIPSDIPLYHIDDLEKVIEQENITIAALCTPEVVAQGIANRLTNTKLVAILNYSRARLQTPNSMIVRDKQMICSFMQLCYEVENKQQEE